MAQSHGWISGWPYLILLALTESQGLGARATSFPYQVYPAGDTIDGKISKERHQVPKSRSGQSLQGLRLRPNNPADLVVQVDIKCLKALRTPSQINLGFPPA